MRFVRFRSTQVPSRHIDDIFATLVQQSVAASGTTEVERVIPTLALNIKKLKVRRA